MCEDDVTGEPQEVAAVRHTDTCSRARCGYCDSAHIPGKNSFPANGAICRSCSKVGHFKRCCKSRPAPSASVVSGAVTAAAAQISRHPRLVVAVSQAQSSGPSPTSVSAVADTGAMICVAGLTLLHDLGLHPRRLQTCKGLRDVADKQLQRLGSASLAGRPRLRMSTSTL